MITKHNIYNGESHSPDGQYVALSDYEQLEAELAELRKDRERMKRENGALRSAFHVNMLKAYPQKSHQEISDEIDNAMKGVNLPSGMSITGSYPCR